MKITILVDDEESWFVPYAVDLQHQFECLKNQTKLIHNAKEACGGDICFLLSCSKIVKRDFLQKHRHNIVVHASDLPAGRGFAPLKRQILEGKNDIVLTLFEAVEEVDAGSFYMKECLHFDGTELLNTLQKRMAEKINAMCIKYAMAPETYPPIQQQGQESFYPRFTEADDMLDIDKSIKDQFNHFRIADNERYPLWFVYKGKKYVLRIEEYSREA